MTPTEARARRRLIDKRRMVMYAPTEADKARIWKAAAKWAERTGCPQSRAVSRFCMELILAGLDTGPPEQLEDQVDQAGISVLLSGVQRAVDAWTEEPYDHVKMSAAIDEVTEQMKERIE